ncbi:hypothetical protein BJ742DRAFT_804022 [Cladochytrium replicatum]|nr:hypothetical protein BJ742DRAFT_804022 [Cladochytrium replicatum]
MQDHSAINPAGSLSTDEDEVAARAEKVALARKKLQRFKDKKLQQRSTSQADSASGSGFLVSAGSLPPSSSESSLQPGWTSTESTPPISPRASAAPTPLLNILEPPRAPTTNSQKPPPQPTVNTGVPASLLFGASGSKFSDPLFGGTGGAAQSGLYPAPTQRKSSVTASAPSLSIPSNKPVINVPPASLLFGGPGVEDSRGSLSDAFSVLSSGVSTTSLGPPPEPAPKAPAPSNSAVGNIGLFGLLSAAKDAVSASFPALNTISNATSPILSARATTPTSQIPVALSRRTPSPTKLFPRPGSPRRGDAVSMPSLAGPEPLEREFQRRLSINQSVKPPAVDSTNSTTENVERESVTEGILADVGSSEFLPLEPTAEEAEEGEVKPFTNAKVDERERELNARDIEVADREAAAKRRLARIEARERDVALREHDVDERERVVDELERKLAEKKAELADLARGVSELDAVVKERESEVLRREVDVASREATVSAHLRKVEVREADVEDLTEALRVRTRALEAREASADASAADRSYLDEQRAILESELAKVAEERKRLREVEHAAAEAESKMREVEDRVLRQGQEVERQRDEIERRLRDLDARESEAEKMIARREAEIENLKQEAEREAAARAEERARLEIEVRSREAAVGAREKQVRATLEHLEEVQAGIDRKREELKRDEAQLRARADSIEQDTQRHAKMMQQIEDDRRTQASVDASAQSALTARNIEVSTLASQLDARQRDLDTLTASLAEREARVQKLYDQIASQQRSIADGEKSLAEAKAKWTEYQKEILGKLEATRGEVEREKLALAEREARLQVGSIETATLTKPIESTTTTLPTAVNLGLPDLGLQLRVAELEKSNREYLTTLTQLTELLEHERRTKAYPAAVPVPTPLSSIPQQFHHQPIIYQPSMSRGGAQRPLTTVAPTATTAAPPSLRTDLYNYDPMNLGPTSPGAMSSRSEVEDRVQALEQRIREMTSEDSKMRKAILENQAALMSEMRRMGKEKEGGLRSPGVSWDGEDGGRRKTPSVKRWENSASDAGIAYGAGVEGAGAVGSVDPNYNALMNVVMTLLNTKAASEPVVPHYDAVGAGTRSTSPSPRQQPRRIRESSASRVAPNFASVPGSPRIGGIRPGVEIPISYGRRGTGYGESSDEDASQSRNQGGGASSYREDPTRTRRASGVSVASGSEQGYSRTRGLGASTYEMPLMSAPIDGARPRLGGGGPGSPRSTSPPRERYRGDEGLGSLSDSTRRLLMKHRATLGAGRSGGPGAGAGVVRPSSAQDVRPAGVGRGAGDEWGYNGGPGVGRVGERSGRSETVRSAIRQKYTREV